MNTTLPASRLLGIVALLVSAQLLCAQSTPGIRITLLGTGNPRPVMERFGPSILVEAGNQKLLFDCGRGCAQRLFATKIPFNELSTVFLTHLHSDHVVGIPDLWLTGWVMGRKIPFRIQGPSGTEHMMSALQQAYEFDIHTRRDLDENLPLQGVAVDAKDIGPGTVWDTDGVKVTAFLVDHGHVKPAFGYRIDYGGHSVVLSGDTRYSENLIRFAKGTEVLVHEVLDVETYESYHTALTPQQMQKVVEHHTSAEQAGKVFAAVRPKLAVFSHIVPADPVGLVEHTRQTYSGPLEVGEDLMTIDIGDTVQVHRPTH